MEFLSSHHTARLATVGANGMPHVIPIAVFHDPEADTLVIGANSSYGESVMASSKKFRDAQRQPKVALVLDDSGPRILEVRGHAEAHLDGGAEAGKRVGSPFEFNRAWIEIRPSRVVTVGINGAPMEYAARNLP
jgi:pyridoxamine 5'-phosphate oxidase family protein